MKTIKLLIISMAAIVCCGSSCESCEDKDLTTLPPETQTGANTFGCYVNNKLFVGINNQRYAPPTCFATLNAQYLRTRKHLTISAYGKEWDMEISIANPEEGKNLMFSAVYHNRTTRRVYQDVAKENIGEVYLTKFDTINQIVSGTFSCKINIFLYLSNDSNYREQDSVVYVTQGRFDSQLGISDN